MGLWAKARRMAAMTTYPQTMPNANENRIVKRTIEEAMNGVIAYLLS